MVGFMFLLVEQIGGLSVWNNNTYQMIWVSTAGFICC